MKLVTAVLALLFGILSGVTVADPYPEGLIGNRMNGSAKPVTENGITTFQITSRECSRVNYDNGSGENDCVNGNVRSVINGGFSDRLGDAVEYRFDIRIPDPVSYRVWINSHASGHIPRGEDSRLHIAQWQGNARKSFVYMLKLDGTRGVTFLGRPCISAQQMKVWNTFSLKTRWANDKRGWVVVKCNDDIIYVKEGTPTNRPDFCFITNECQPGKTMNPKRLQFAVGPVMKGFGPEWKKYNKPSPFTDFPDPIRMEIRNLSITKGARLYGREEKTLVANLQAHLAGLGCDPGPVDGVMGAKTRSAALSCRDFVDGELPEAVNFQTLANVLSAYQTRFPIQQ